jgi:hypothetical protein
MIFLIVFRKWFFNHSIPPEGHYSVIPTIKNVWWGYETLAVIVADKDTVKPGLASISNRLDRFATINLLE